MNKKEYKELKNFFFMGYPEVRIKGEIGLDTMIMFREAHNLGLLEFHEFHVTKETLGVVIKLTKKGKFLLNFEPRDSEDTENWLGLTARIIIGKDEDGWKFEETIYVHTKRYVGNLGMYKGE